jgi:hypothetical protein
MSIGAVRYDLGQINKGDTAELKAALRVADGVVEADEIASVTFTVQRPNGIIEEPVEGRIEPNGEGYFQWLETEEEGKYLAQAQFLLTTGEIRSCMVNFTVEDPFRIENKLEEILAEEVWFRLEDCFEAIEGGPWLRDETLANFDQSKIRRFIGEVLLDINVQEPKTRASIGEFVSTAATPNPNLPLLAKGVLCKTIQHMIRSYAEVAVPVGGQVVYEERANYWQRWSTIYKSEHEDYYTMVRLWKRGFLGYGKSALLVSSKAGRLFYGSVQRTRNAGRGGYY